MYVVLYILSEPGLTYYLCNLGDTTASCRVIVHGMNTWMVSLSS